MVGGWKGKQGTFWGDVFSLDWVVVTGLKKNKLSEQYT